MCAMPRKEVLRYMCRIYYARQMQGGKIPEWIVERIKRIAGIEATSNKDGWGAAYRSGDDFKITKSLKEFTTKALDVPLNTKEFILHLRASTGGVGIENTQPLEKNNWVLIHNGVVRTTGKNYSGVSDVVAGFDTENSITESYHDRHKYNYPSYLGKDVWKGCAKSDTREWLEEIVSAEGNSTDRIKKTVDALWGSYSCFMIDPRNRVFYFKSDCTAFEFVLVGDTIVGMTSGKSYNKWFSPRKYGEFPLPQSTFIPAADSIYEITPKSILWRASTKD